MKEKELRLALVCYGGVSLAIYMHGVTKEILKLLRASRHFQAIPDLNRRRQIDFAEASGAPAENDTSSVYYQLLCQIGKQLDLRVIVDVIAGASAGGINGILLARAIAHDLDYEPLRRMWLEKADVTDLMYAQSRATFWSKWFLHPIIWFLTRGRLRRVASATEARTKLSMFLRSRWFRPPFDGARFTVNLMDAMEAMAKGRKPGTLIPHGQMLEAFATITDFYGYSQEVAIHDPPQVREREHRHVLRFRYQHWPNGDGLSQFDASSIPQLAFAARATSCFPGAFPPAQIAEIDRIMAERGKVWSTREDFIRDNFQPYINAGQRPDRTSFIDGSVLNSKPFAEAIQAIRGRPAYRQVDRRLVYIEPHPVAGSSRSRTAPPGFLQALLGSISTIPRNQPIHDDLAWINGHNAHARRVKTVIEAARPHVTREVEVIAGTDLSGTPTYRQIADWRERANSVAAQQAGFAYQGYVRLKIAAVLDNISTMFCDCAGIEQGTPQASLINDMLVRWAEQKGIAAVDGALLKSGIEKEREAPPWVQFLLRFDVGFRTRRLRFVIRALNDLYGFIGSPAHKELRSETLDELKSSFYDALDIVRRKMSAASLSSSLRAAMAKTAHRATNDVVSASISSEEINLILEQLSTEHDLSSLNKDVDEIFGMMALNYLGPGARQELLISYIGFAFWDVVTFSITNWRDLGEYDEIRVDRISPDDAQALRAGGAEATLKGIGLNHFAAFFSRAFRENDYLWGRLHAADRLIDIVMDAASADGARADIDVKALKRQIFATILDDEEPHLSEISDTVQTLKDEIARL